MIQEDGDEACIDEIGKHDTKADPKKILRYEIKDELHTISKKLFKLQKLLNTMNFHKKQ